MTLTQNARTVLEKRYLIRDENGELTETPEEMLRRVARHVAAADKLFDPNASLELVEAEFYEVMNQLEFMPNSPTLMNAGRPLGQLSACFVLPVGDSMEEIFEAVKNAALIHKSGGGTGFSFSRLRPQGATVRSTGGVASGPVSFMKVFNAATEAVKQGGTRRGANMGILRADHPDILSFIHSKRENLDITNFNISVGLTAAFMQAAQQRELYDLIDPKTGAVVAQANAGEVLDEIVEHAWNNGEPGIVFLDRLNRDNVTPHLGEIESTNPCGEQPLLPYESCNLGSINLAQMVEIQDGNASVDYTKLARVVDTAVHFLDNVIEVNQYPLPEIERMTKATRKIGLGVMGFADMLFRLEIPYNSEQGVALAGQVMCFIQQQSRRASEALAEKRGAFPEFPHSTLQQDHPRRNATTTTIAPTGTISMICGATSGVEPLFALSFIRNIMDQNHLIEVHPYFQEIARQHTFDSEQMMRRIAHSGSLHDIGEIPEQVRRVFVTAHDISPEYHIRMQAAFQAYTDNAVSKTVNFPNTATREDVRVVFMLAYTLGCKGVTIYRDGSREMQVLNIGQTVAHEPAEEKIVPRPRPDVTQGVTEKVKIGCGTLFITVNYDQQGICEVFTNVGRAGGCPAQSEATSRLVSVALRAGMDPKSVIEQLRGIRCHSTLRQQGLRVLSCPDAIGRVIEKVMQAHMQPEQMQMNILSGVQAEDEGLPTRCPDCGLPLGHEGGCVICHGCGYSKCQ